MADESSDNIKNVTNQVSSLNDSISDLNQSLGDILINVSQFGVKAEKSLGKANKSFLGLKKTISLNSKEYKVFDDLVEHTSSGVAKLGNAYLDAFKKGNKQAMAATTVIMRYGFKVAAAARECKRLTDEIDNQTIAYNASMKALEKSNVDLDIAEKKLSKLKETYADTHPAVIKATKAVEKYSAAQKKNTEEANTAIVTSLAHTTALEKEQQEVVRLNKAIIDDLETSRQTKRDIDKMAGGARGLAAAFGDVVESRMFEYLRKAGTLAAVGAGFVLINKVLSQTADHAKAVSRAAMSLGNTGDQVGRYAKSGVEAGKTIASLQMASIDLGFSMEDMEGVMHKVRSGIRMDKEGQLTEEAIRGMSREAAMFARVSGMELLDSVNLLETRIKRYGMTSAEATSNMQEMRNTIIQMTAGNKGNTVVMGDMVDIIEEASAASQSYIVDTRLMTQALRGAVNQAEHLGAAQAQAKDVAKATGKILSGTPDYIKLPAGFDLVKQLTGKHATKSADELLLSLDKGTRKQVLAIQEGLKSGRVGEYSAAKALMSLIGDTEAGVAAKSEQLEKTLLKNNSEAAAIIAEQFSIDNDATALMVTTMMQQTVRMREKLGKDNISFATLLVKDTADFNAAIESAKDDAGAKEALAKKGLSHAQVEEYFKTYKDGLVDADKIRVQLAELGNRTDYQAIQKRNQLNDELFMATTAKQTKLLDEQLHPVKHLIKRVTKPVEGAQEKPWDITATFNKEALTAAKIDTAEKLADALGVNYEENKKVMDDAFNKGKTSAELQAIKNTIGKTAEDQRLAAEAMNNLLVSPLESLNYATTWIMSKFNEQGQWTKIFMGAGIALAGMWYLARGQKRVLEWAVGLTEIPTTNAIRKTLGGKQIAGAVGGTSKGMNRGFLTAGKVLSGAAAAAMLIDSIKSSGELGKTLDEHGNLIEKNSSLLDRSVDQGIKSFGLWSTATMALGLKFGALITVLEFTASAIMDLFPSWKGWKKERDMTAERQVGLESAEDTLIATNARAKGLSEDQSRKDLVARGKLDGKRTYDSWTGAIITDQTHGIEQRQLYHTGGLVHGMGDVASTLQSGEFVLKKDAVSSIGISNLQRLNALPNMASMAGTPTRMPDAPRYLGTPQRSVGSGGFGRPTGLESSVNAQSLTPDGALTLKVHGFNDILGEFLKNRRAMVGT